MPILTNPKDIVEFKFPNYLYIDPFDAGKIERNRIQNNKVKQLFDKWGKSLKEIYKEEVEWKTNYSILLKNGANFIDILIEKNIIPPTFFMGNDYSFLFQWEVYLEARLPTVGFTSVRPNKITLYFPDIYGPDTPLDVECL